MKLQKTPIPLYHQLEKVLKKRILSGMLRPDQALPAEKELCKEFGVSRTTVRQALLSLEGEDLIVREQGRGTFVKNREISMQKLRLYGTVDDLFDLSVMTSLKLHSKKLIDPGPTILEEMKLHQGEKAYLFEGVRSWPPGNKAFFQAYVAEPIGKDIQVKDVQHPIFLEQVERKALEMVKRALQVTTAAVANKSLATALNIPEGHPILVVKRIYLSRSDRCLEVAITSFPGDTYQAMAELERVNL